jgi:hypothetical protein
MTVHLCPYTVAAASGVCVLIALSLVFSPVAAISFIAGFTTSSLLFLSQQSWEIENGYLDRKT